MGNHLYVAKTYIAEFDYGIGFNHKVSEFHELLRALGITYSGGLWNTRFKVEKSQWLNGINKLKNFNSLDNKDQNNILEAIKDCEYKTVDEIISLFEGYYNISDQKHEYLEFKFM